jgi:PST family polysaccharide transporter
LQSALRAAALTAPVALMIYLLRSWIVKLLFSPSFMPVVDLIPWQLAGDVVKMVAWVLTMTLTALMRARWFIASEIARAITFVGVAACFMGSHGAVAANWGYCAASMVQIMVAAVALRDLIGPGAAALKESNP